MTDGTYTEHFKSASPLRGGFPASAMAGGNFGSTTIGDTISISTTLASCVMFLTTVNAIMPASGPVVTQVTTSGMVTLTFPALCSGSWIAIGY